jgi:hypothetical protein
MTSLADVDLPRARFVARALVDVGRPMIDRAWGYLVGWQSLERARVPPQLRRELLPTKFLPTETEALIRIRKWAATRSLILVVASGVGLGKSFAAGDWLNTCRQSGRSIAWLSAASLAKLPLDRDPKREADRSIVVLGDEERRALDAYALVIDDIGAGSLGPFMLSRIKGLIFEREAAGRRTLILLNEAKVGATSLLESLFDDRLTDRMTAGGGSTIHLKGSKSMRSKPAEDDLTSDGRGRAWFAAANLIELVGCVDGRDGSAWSPGQARHVLDPIFGERLEAALVQAANSPTDEWLTEAETVRRSLGVDANLVSRAAFDCEDRDRVLRSDSAFAPVKLDGQRGEVVSTFAFLDRLREDVDTDRRRSARESEREDSRRAERIQSVGQLVGSRPAAPRIAKIVEALPDGERARLASIGFRVIYSSALDEFEVRYKAQGDQSGSELSAVEKKHGRLKASTLTEREGWAIAAELAAVNALSQGRAEAERATG